MLPFYETSIVVLTFLFLFGGGLVMLGWLGDRYDSDEDSFIYYHDSRFTEHCANRNCGERLHYVEWRR